MKSILFIFIILLISLINCQDSNSNIPGSGPDSESLEPSSSSSSSSDEGTLEFPTINPNYESYISYNDFIERVTFSMKETNFQSEDEKFTLLEFGSNDKINIDWSSEESKGYLYNGTNWLQFPYTKNMKPSIHYFTDYTSSSVKEFKGYEIIDRGFKCSVFSANVSKTFKLEKHPLNSIDLESVNVTEIQNTSDKTPDTCFNNLNSTTVIVSAIFNCSFDANADVTECEITYTYNDTSSEITPSPETPTPSPETPSPETPTPSPETPSPETPTPSPETPSPEIPTPSPEETTPDQVQKANLIGEDLPSEIKLQTKTTTCKFNQILTIDFIKAFGTVSSTTNVTMEINGTLNVRTLSYFVGNIPIRFTAEGTFHDDRSKDVNMNIGFVDWQTLESLPTSIPTPDCEYDNCYPIPSGGSWEPATPKEFTNATTLNIRGDQFSALFENVDETENKLIYAIEWYHFDNETNAFEAYQTLHSRGESLTFIPKDNTNAISINTFTLSCDNAPSKPESINPTIIEILTDPIDFTFSNTGIRRSANVDIWTKSVVINENVTQEIRLFTYQRGWTFYFRTNLNSTEYSIPMAIEIIQDGLTTEIDIFNYDHATAPSIITNIDKSQCVPNLPTEFNTMITMNNLLTGYTQQYQEIYSSLKNASTITIGKYHSVDMVSIGFKNNTVSQWGHGHKCRSFNKVDDFSLYNSSVSQNMLSSIYQPLLANTYKGNVQGNIHQWVAKNNTHTYTYTWSIESGVATPINVTIGLYDEDKKETIAIQTLEFSLFSTNSTTSFVIPSNCKSIDDSIKADLLQADESNEESDDDSDDDSDDEDEDKLFGPKPTKNYSLPTVDVKNYPKLSTNFTVNIEITKTSQNGTVTSTDNVIWMYSKDKLAQSFNFANATGLIGLCYTDTSMSTANVTKDGKTNGPYGSSYFNQFFIRDGSITKLFTDAHFLKYTTISQDYSTINELKAITLSKSNDGTVIYYYPSGWVFETIDDTTVQAPILIRKFNSADNSTETWKIIKYDTNVDSSLYSNCKDTNKDNFLGINISRRNGIIIVCVVIATVILGAGAIIFVVIKKRGGLSNKQPAHILLDENNLVSPNDQNRMYEN